MKALRIVEDLAEIERELARLARRGEDDLARVEPQVRPILEAVARDGDAAVRRFVREFEKRDVTTLFISEYGGRAALDRLPADVRSAMNTAATRIRRYHERQMEDLVSFEYTEDRIRLGSRISPISRVGVYAPGGKATYPSSVLMSAIPAKVAGVPEVIVASPAPNDALLAACELAGVTAIVDAGGAQAIAALAFGTETVPAVHKIVGPGNLYVAAAKRLVFGRVSIDSIAGPSEILILADDDANADLIAADLLSQAEHDEAAYPILVCTNRALAEAVARELGVQLETLPRRKIAEAALENVGVMLVVSDEDALANVANRLAIEHVALHVREPSRLADRVRHAGALFLGAHTPEAAGDYLAGPSHVLPTGGAARHSSPLGVYDFITRSSVIEYEDAALLAQADEIASFARAEGLEAHARAVEIRAKRLKQG